MRLVPGHEEEPAVAVRSERPPQRLGVARRRSGSTSGRLDGISASSAPKAARNACWRRSAAWLAAQRAGLADRRVEVVAEPGHVVGVAGRVRLLAFRARRPGWSRRRTCSSPARPTRCRSCSGRPPRRRAPPGAAAGGRRSPCRRRVRRSPAGTAATASIRGRRRSRSSMRSGRRRRCPGRPRLREEVVLRGTCRSQGASASTQNPSPYPP